MKKLLLTGAAIYLLASASAFAEVNVGINLGGAAQPVVVAPQPVVVAQPVFVDRGPGYDPHHHDQHYWAEKQRWEHDRRERERHEHEHRVEHRDHHEDHHDHHDEHHDDHRDDHR